MLKSCKYCGRVHDSHFHCGKKPQRVKQCNDKDKFRWSRAWQAKREEIKELDSYLCRVCRDKNRYVYNNLECHHIVSLEDNFELRLENGNLITVCERCHEKSEKGIISKDYLFNLIKDR